MMETKDLIAIIVGLIGTISAVLALLSAYYGYKTKRADRISPAGSESSTIQFVALHDRPPENVYKTTSIISVILIFILGITSTVVLIAVGVNFWLSLWIGLMWLSVAAGPLLMLRRLKGDTSRKSSRTKYETRVTIIAPYATVFTRCQNILHRMGAIVYMIDYELGIIEGIKNSFWTTPFKMKIAISRTEEGRCTVRIESDSLLSWAIYDFRKNERRVREFVQNLAL